MPKSCKSKLWLLSVYTQTTIFYIGTACNTAYKDLGFKGPSTQIDILHSVGSFSQKSFEVSEPNLGEGNSFEKDN